MNLFFLPKIKNKIWQFRRFPLKYKEMETVDLQEKRLRIIEDCLAARKPRIEANKILKQNNLKELEGGEKDCYDVVFNCNIGKSIRDKIIAGCLLQGMTRTDANLEIINNNFRKMDEKEGENYDDYLSRLRYFGTGIFKIIKKEKILPTRNEIIKNAIRNSLPTDSVNKKLVQNNFDPLSDTEDEKYRKDYNEYHHKRQTILRQAYEEEKTIPEVNKILFANKQEKLSSVEEMDFQKERGKIQSKRRDNLIKECLEERMSLHQINVILNNNSFDRLSEQEYDKLKIYITKGSNNKKSTELSDQFRTLYRSAIKKYHPDHFSDKEKKELATLRMKEINEAKEKSDYFLLKELILKFDEQDKNQ